ncbi:amidohydrolase [Oleomonas cavernae]|uniref:Amidohydrolase n=1 Tax=Oleomonas cavernae TaxID=2320859 RepID=A0A418WHB0_9PROT|nr:amidohydrolase [Oleomonas cavernae]
MPVNIDLHAHFVPQAFPDGRGRSALWPAIEHRPDGRAAIVIGGRPFRVLDACNWDSAARLADLAAEGVDRQVISPMPELLSHWFDAAEADLLSRHMNEALAALVATQPDRYLGLGMVPVQDPELAARRLEEVKTLGLRGVEIGSHINGLPLGDASLDPFYAAAQALDLAIMVHPLHPVGRERLGGNPALAAAAAFPLDTALAGASLLAAGIPDKYPRLRILLCHGGGALPWILPRLDQVWSLGGSLGALFPRKPSEMARKFYYDTVLYDAPSLRFLAQTVGIDRIAVGSDYPFVIQQGRPVDFALGALHCPGEQLARNALDFLGLGHQCPDQ